MHRSPEPASAAERAYHAIRNGIIDGTRQPGTMLGETPLADDLGVSRTPVRAALARLQDEGWIVIYPKRGALVQGLTERQIEELAETRQILETAAVGQASQHERTTMARHLTNLLTAQRDAFEAADLHAFIDLTVRFHRGFVQSSQNQILLELYDRLADRHRFLLFASGPRLLARSSDVLTEHALLVHHLHNGDIAEFTAVLTHHISESCSIGTPLRR